ncbi:MAG: hypothetical protein ABW185_08260, partial [Sedimenticola sp.]
DSYSWNCLLCGLPNFSSSFFDSSASLTTSNMFSDLDLSASPIRLTSTPMKRTDSQNKNKQNRPRTLKLLNINFQSIVNKQAEFYALLDEEKPDIVVGTETWLSPNILSSELFPANLGYTPYREDRKSTTTRSGGVIILVSHRLICTAKPDFKTDCEITWVSIEVVGAKPTHIAAFYRPREDDLISIEELRKSVEQVSKKKGNIWISGDFNLPKLIDMG